MVPQVAPSSSSAIAAHENVWLFILAVSSSDWNSHSGPNVSSAWWHTERTHNGVSRRQPTLRAGEVDAVDSRVRLLRHRISPFSWRYQHKKALLSVERRPARCLRNTAHQFLADQVEGRRFEQVP